MKTIKRVSLGCVLMLGLVALLWHATARAGAPVPMGVQECKDRCRTKEFNCKQNAKGGAELDQCNRDLWECFKDCEANAK